MEFTLKNPMAILLLFLLFTSMHQCDSRSHHLSIMMFQNGRMSLMDSISGNTIWSIALNASLSELSGPSLPFNGDKIYWDTQNSIVDKVLAKLVQWPGEFSYIHQSSFLVDLKSGEVGNIGDNKKILLISKKLFKFKALDWNFTFSTFQATIQGKTKLPIVHLRNGTHFSFLENIPNLILDQPPLTKNYYKLIAICFILVIMAYNIPLSTSKKQAPVPLDTSEISTSKKQAPVHLDTSEISTSKKQAPVPLDTSKKRSNTISKRKKKNHYSEENSKNENHLQAEQKSTNDKFFISNIKLGEGSSGTVYEGMYHGRQIAVKSLTSASLAAAEKEFAILIDSDRHHNVVRCYGVEHGRDSAHVILERCTCNLNDFILNCKNPLVEPIKGLGIDKAKKCALLWRDGTDYPSPELLKLMRDIACGIEHLHVLNIIHRDLMPENILIVKEKKALRAKISDMGISKRIPEGESSLGSNTSGSGTGGWRAPEQIHHTRQTCAVDSFGLGCTLFFCLTKGEHPFGRSKEEREKNISNDKSDLFLVDLIPEAKDLISRLIQHDPRQRPTASASLLHPFFWNPEKRIRFLKAASDRLELEPNKNNSFLISSIERAASSIFGVNWHGKMGRRFLIDIQRKKKYDGTKVRDLLRVVRNKGNHYYELGPDIQAMLGPVPDGFELYFLRRFPNLLFQVYQVISKLCSKEECFKDYF